MKITITEDQSKFIIDNSFQIIASDGTWMYIPYWFKATEDPNVFEVHSHDTIPDALKEAIIKSRETLS